MIIATHGIVASQLAGFDADAQAFFDRVTTAGGSLSATEKTAVNKLVLDLKGYSIWTKMKAIYPMVGASAAACAQNLKSSSFTGTFTSGWTYASTGVTGNGTSAYMDTNLIPFTSISSNNSTHISYYINQNAKIGAFQMGVRGTPSSNDLFIGAKFNSTSNYVTVNISSPNVTTDNSTVTGFLLATRIISTEYKYFKNNILHQTSTITSSGLAENQKVYLGALNLQGSILLPDDTRCAFSSIGDGLTDTEASNFYTAVNAFQTTLARQV